MSYDEKGNTTHSKEDILSIKQKYRHHQVEWPKETKTRSKIRRSKSYTSPKPRQKDGGILHSFTKSTSKTLSNTFKNKSHSHSEDTIVVSESQTKREAPRVMSLPREL